MSPPPGAAAPPPSMPVGVPPSALPLTPSSLSHPPASSRRLSAPFAPSAPSAPSTPSAPSAPHAPPASAPRLVSVPRSAAPPRGAPRRSTSRGERLTHALRRGFVSARALRPRSAPPPVVELLGALGPERYMSLAPRSTEAARAIVAVGLGCGVRDAERLEKFRRLGRVRGKALREAEGREPAKCWFDAVAEALLGEGEVQGADLVEGMAVGGLGVNESEVHLRRSLMPAEAYRVEATGGVDYTEVIACKALPAGMGDAGSSAPGRVNGVTEMEEEGKAQTEIAAIESVEDHLLPTVDIEALDGVDDSRLDSSARKNIDPKENEAHPCVEAETQSAGRVENKAMSGPSLSLLEDDGPLGPAANGGNALMKSVDIMDVDNLVPIVVEDDAVEVIEGATPSGAHADLGSDSGRVNGPDSHPAVPPNRGMFTGAATNGPGISCKAKKLPGSEGPHSANITSAKQPELIVRILHNDSNGRVSVDIDLLEEGQAVRDGQHALAQSHVNNRSIPSPGSAPRAGGTGDTDAPKNVNSENGVILEGVSSDDFLPVACNVRRDAPTSMLQEMLDDLGREDMVPPVDKAKGAMVPKSEVVALDDDDDDEGFDAEGSTALAVAPHTPSSQRVKKSTRKSIDVASQRRSSREETELRGAMVRSKVMQTMPEPPQARKAREVRASLPVTSVRLGQTRHARGVKRRSSRRTKKVQSIVDSSEEGEPFVSKQEDEDFHVGEERAGGELLTPRTSSTAQKDAPRPDRSITPEVLPPRSVPERQPPKNSVAALEYRPAVSRDPLLEHNCTNISRNALPSSNKAGEEVQLWDREINRVEKMVKQNASGSPSISSSDDDDETPYAQFIPILRRILRPVLAGERDILEVEQFDEHSEVMQFYKDSRLDSPYAPDAPSAGTHFAMECWRASRLNAGLPSDAGTDEDESVEEELNRGLVVGKGRRLGLSRPSSNSEDSSEDSSNASVTSDENNEDALIEEGGSRPHRSGSRVSRARKLQNRVCGNYLDGMSAEAKRRVLLWAERDFSWFESGADMMEVVADSVQRPCGHCDNIDGDVTKTCEESILLKLWKSLSWRKVRRMRHRGRTSAED